MIDPADATASTNGHDAAEAGDSAALRQRCGMLGIPWAEDKPTPEAAAVALIGADVAVRLRVVPVSERSGFGPLPNYEFHADPPPDEPGRGNLVRWDPPVTVSINWAGLPGAASSPTWAHFRHDPTTGTWEPVLIEFDAEIGILRFTTDQP